MKALSSTELRTRLPMGSLLALLTALASLVYLIFFVYYARGTNEFPLTLASFLNYFWRTEQWQHCWFVLPALGFIVFQQRETFRGLPIKGENIGLLVLAAALVVYWIGFRVDNYLFGFLSIQLMIAGLIIWFLGWRWMLATIFPFFFMTFLWPLYFLEADITFPLRTVMSKASVTVLNLIGVPAVLNGTGILSAPDVMTGTAAGKRFSLDVADPCSGIKSLFALMMVSAIYAQLTLKTWWQKWLLFFCSVPLAIVGNLFRILALTFGVMALGSNIAIGPDGTPSFFHEMAGFVVFAVALGGMIAIGWALEQVIRVDRDAVRAKFRPTTARAEKPGKPSTEKDRDLY